MLGTWRQDLLTVTRPTYHGILTAACSLYLPISPYISLYLPISPWVETGAMMRCDEGRVLVQEYVGLGLG